MKPKITAAILALALLAGCTPSEPSASAPASPETSVPTSSAPSTEPSGIPSDEPSAEPSESQSAEPSPSGPPVYTDWSQLDPAEYPDLIRHYSDLYCGSELAAGKDYGTLLPYVGTLNEEYYPVDMLYTYGLTDREGGIVTDPVYSDVSFVGDFLLLTDSSDYDPGLGHYEQPPRILAAKDGSWILGEKLYFGREVDGYAVMYSEDGALVLIDPDGKRAAEISAEAASGFFGVTEGLKDVWSAVYFVCVYEGVLYGVNSVPDPNDATVWTEEPVYIDIAGGTLLASPPEGYPEKGSESYEDYPSKSFPGYTDAAVQADAVTGELYYTADGPDGGVDLLDGDGNVVWKDFDWADVVYPLIADGTLGLIPDQYSGKLPLWFCRYDLGTGECILRCPIIGNMD